MTLRIRAFRHVGGVVVVCALVAACSHPAPQTPSPSPTPVVSTPKETQLERQQRLDFQAAENSYRANMAEQDRLFSSTGARLSTKRLASTASGAYLAFILRMLAAARAEGWYADHPTLIAGFSLGKYQPAQLSMFVCEDNRKVHLVYKSGKVVTPSDTRMYVQDLAFRRLQGVWKITDLRSYQVKTFAKDTRCGTT